MRVSLTSTLRTVSLLCYCCTFLQGWIIALPFIFVLTIGLPDAEPEALPFLLLADLGLIILAILRFTRKSKWTFVLEGIIYLTLLAPLVRVLVVFPLRLFSGLLFFVPFGGFVLLYPLSMVGSWREYRAREFNSEE